MHFGILSLVVGIVGLVDHKPSAVGTDLENMDFNSFDILAVSYIDFVAFSNQGFDSLVFNQTAANIGWLIAVGFVVVG